MNLDAANPGSVDKLIHELEVSRVELEMQNDELELAQSRLASAVERYSALYDFAPTGYFTLDSRGIIIETNLAGASLLHTERAELTGQRFASFVVDRPAFANFLERTMSGQSQQSCEFVLDDAKQALRTVLIEASRPHCDRDECWISASEITERTRLNAAMVASEMRYRRLFEASRDGILILNADTGRIVDVNPFLCKLLGYPTSAFIGRQLWELGLFKDIVANEVKFVELQKRGFVRYEDLPLETAEGRRIDVEFVSNLYAVDGHRVIQCNIRDITERKKVEQKNRQLSRAVEQNPASIVITDAEGKIEYVNPKFERLTGYTFDEVRGKNPRVLKSDDTAPQDYAGLWQTICSGKEWRGEFHNRKKNGEMYWESASISPLRDASGKITHFIAVKEDVTERKKIETDLADARTRADAANVAKSDFLAVMSHELRTPLNGVIGFAELLTCTPLNAEQMEYVTTIQSSGEHLLSLVTDILDFSSIEKGRMALETAEVDVGELVETSFLPLRKQASDKGLEFLHEIAPDAPTTITGDARRLRQILINLLGNAVKCTAKGSVALRVATAGSGDARCLEFAVKDTGCGITPEALEKLFKPFSQADTSLHRPFAGAGLGLVISQRLAEAMGGRICVESTPDIGSTFKFRFPLKIGGIAALCPPQTTPAPVLRSGLVLVVEDDQVNASLAVNMLQAIGMQSEVAANGREAVDAFVPGKYAAILMDIHMPVMSGLEAASKIREAEAAQGTRVPIIALTAKVMAGDRECCVAAGMDDFISKPFKKEILSATLRSHL